METFAKRLRQRAEELGLSLAQVARKADVSERSFSHYAAERSEPDLATLARVAKALGVTADYLVGLVDDRPQSPSDGAEAARQRIAATTAMLDAAALEYADRVLVGLLELERGRHSGGLRTRAKARVMQTR
jgi:transcriptional regulator with XRE-family HTH domain